MALASGARGGQWRVRLAARCSRRELLRLYPKLVFRIGWEWNARSFFPWRCVDVALAPDYIAYFRRIVDRFRAGCPIARSTGARPRRATPTPPQGHGGDWSTTSARTSTTGGIATPTQAEWDKDYGATYLGGPKGIGARLGYARSKVEGCASASGPGERRPGRRRRQPVLGAEDAPQPGGRTPGTWATNASDHSSRGSPTQDHPGGGPGVPGPVLSRRASVPLYLAVEDDQLERTRVRSV